MGAFIVQALRGGVHTVALADGGTLVIESAPVPSTPFAQTFAQFYGIASAFGLPDYAGQIAVGAACPFPELGPSSGAGAPSALSASTFLLPNIGIYQVTFQVTITEAPAQLGLAIGGVLLSTPVCVAGRNAAGAQIAGDFVFNTTVPNEVLSIINPLGSPAPLTVTPKAGGSNANSATLMIQQIG